MAIEKMRLCNIVGSMPDLEEALSRCVASGVFHPEMAIDTSEKNGRFAPLPGENQAAGPLKLLFDLAEDLELKLQAAPGEGLDPVSAGQRVAEIRQNIQDLSDERRALRDSIAQHKQATSLITHVQGLDVPFDQLFNAQYVKVRFGRLPVDSYQKLSFYDDETFFFVDFDHDSSDYWGFYFAPSAKIAVVDDIFRSLYFERLWIPEYAHSKPEEALQTISDSLTKERERLEAVNQELKEIKAKKEGELNRCYTALKAADDAFGIRKYVAVANSHFYLEGFVPERLVKKLTDSLESLQSVNVSVQPVDANPSLTPPTRLRNGWFSRPFETFVRMYGTPSYYEYDPTLLVALTYTLLFGIMFGDLGQGALVWLLGLAMDKIKKMDFGKILQRLGISSMVFGFAYGSVFGLEHLLDPVFKAMGFAGKPIEVFESHTTNKLLIAALFVGAGMISIAMVMNIVTGLRHKNYEKAFFGNNGLAGLVLYLGAVIGISLTMLTSVNVLNPLFIIFIIVVPVLLIFFREPLAKLCAGHKKVVFEDGFGSFFIENFFEMLEYLLSYLSNSMSFLRVGGFILSHAGMMAVVLSLSEMMSGGGSIVVMVLGNLFVMALEGMIAGIQVLRLEFYEIFSRFYSGEGKEYAPLTISCKAAEAAAAEAAAK
ncbi:MAG: ATPase [Oscillospiraceae bacterium]|jgi:V/A-type H+-transporting ATPase subunit I|nr:ATPase [Oscillospiraceae bacterium]